ncbi:MAG: T9SS type A sorting domain-containing protein [Saprospiraceae bacterium]|nr:T9SS type A sorting domain-containing protein [Saprospiraceae bacterium]
MRPILLSLLFALALAKPASSQIVLGRDYFPVVGDTMYAAVDRLPVGVSVGEPGPDKRWMFTSLEAPFIRRSVVRRVGEAGRFPEAEVYVPIGEDAEAYFATKDDAFCLVGLHGTDPLELGLSLSAGFSPPLPERWAPLRYGDTRSSESSLQYPFSADQLPAELLDQLPITPDSLRIRLRIRRQESVDAWGTLTIPGGIYDVLRIARREQRDIRLDARLGIFPWQDVTDLLPQNEALGPDTILSYHFFSNQAPQPIAVVYVNGQDEEVKAVEFKANDITTEVKSVEISSPGVYAFPNPAILDVRFEFYNLPVGEYKLTIYNILGQEVWSERYLIDGTFAERVDLSAFRKGTYLYSLTDERGKTLSTQRLIVVKP